MSDLDPRMRAGLDRLVAVPTRAGDWEDVLRRAARRPRWPLLLAAALALLLAAAALAKALGGFDAWLSGTPGKPAPPAEQRRFEAGERHSWAKFPPGTKLRELLRTKAGGSTYVLLGFRSGDQLCLDVRTAGERARSCAPLSVLANLAQPVLPLELRHRFEGPPLETIPKSGPYNPAGPAVSYGITADGVRSVDLYADDGRHGALLGGNAFLVVEPRAPLDSRARRLVATDAQGRRLQIPVAVPPTAPADEPPPINRTGPQRVQATIAHPTIGWLDRREPRGESPQTAGIPVIAPVRGGKVLFARVLRPDPLSNLRAVVAIEDLPANPQLHQRRGMQTCVGFTVTQQGGMIEGCEPRRQLFAGAPFQASLGGGGPGEQFVVISGFAADGVARIQLFLGSGARERVPLRDNVFVVQAPRAQLPAKLVFYDTQGRVVGISPFGGTS